MTNVIQKSMMLSTLVYLIVGACGYIAFGPRWVGGVCSVCARACAVCWWDGGVGGWGNDAMKGDGEGGRAHGAKREWRPVGSRDEVTSAGCPTGYLPCTTQLTLPLQCKQPIASARRRHHCCRRRTASDVLHNFGGPSSTV